MNCLFRFFGILLAALILTSTVAVAAVPILRHWALAIWSDPASHPALAQDARVRVAGAGADVQAYGAEVARLLPQAKARVEQIHGRPFLHEPVVTVFADLDAYVRANAVGAAPMATTRSGLIVMSPLLWTQRREELAAILTHELSHTHLQQHMGVYAYGQIPSWFHEGLAVMVSDGGGAAAASRDDARAQLRAGRTIAVRDATSLLGFPFDPPQDRGLFPPTREAYNMIYRQAGMFVEFLRAHDPVAFRELLDGVIQGEAFRDIVQKAYGQSLAQMWAQFVAE